MLSNRTPNQSFKLRNGGGGGGGNYKTPNGNKVGTRSRNVTPSRNMDFKGATDGDRYVPQHDQEIMEYAKVSFDDQVRTKLNTSSSLPNSPEKDRLKLNLMRGKSANDVREMDIDYEMFAYRRNNAPKIAGAKKQNVLYKCMNPSSSVRKAKRVYPKTPISTLDAPELLADYYYNILDWSSHQLLAVAIKDKVFTFNVETNDTNLFKDFNNSALIITCVKFSKDGAYLSVGLDNGTIHLFRVEDQSYVRKFGSGNWRICSATWAKSGLLSFGNRGGIIQTHDVRIRHSFISEIQHHLAEVCGIQWVCNDQYLVSGSADAVVNVYTRDQVVTSEPTVLWALDGHNSTIKAITECPFIYGNIIATGGGTNDGTIKFWNLSTGELVTNVVTNNQTSAIVFDLHYREMATCHGSTQNAINVWKYSAPSSDFSLVHEILPNDRPINMVKSPCEEYIAVTTDKETLSFYDLFEKDENFRQANIENRMKQLSLKFNGVRQQIR